jgi:hypothetical protein
MLLLVALQGCSGGVRFAPVTGKVTLDGKPVAKAVVTFNPLPQPGSDIAGDSASGTTDENGQYTLKSYVQGDWKDGAQVGKHKVTISLQESRGEGDRAIIREKLPKNYNRETELKADVTPGSNHIDFELKSH